MRVEAVREKQNSEKTKQKKKHCKKSKSNKTKHDMIPLKK